MKPVEDEVIIQVKDLGFTVSVFEAKTEYTIFHSGPLDGVSLDPTDKLDSGNNLGGDLEDQLHMDRDKRKVLENNGDDQSGTAEDDARASRCEVNLNLNSNSSHLVDQHRECHNEAFKAIVMDGSNHEVCEEGLNVAKEIEVVEKSHLISLNADLEGASGMLEGRQMTRNVVSASSSSRTKTAQLSGNDYSMEMEKLNPSKLHQLQLEQGAGSEVEVSASDVSAPPGFGIEGDTSPPGFEGFAVRNDNISEEDLARSERVYTGGGRRITRSQVKKARTQASRGQSNVVKVGRKSVKDSHIGRKSTDTSESMKKIAEEALAVGELLGIRVISHKANAVKRITDSIKAKRGTARR